MDQIEGLRVRLRDVTLEDADMLDAWAADPELVGGFNDFGLPHVPIDRKVLLLGPMRNEHAGQLIVEVIDGARPIGTVSWHRVGYGPGSDAWMIGIELIAGARGQGYGVEAQVLVARYLFEHTSANRGEAQTDIENTAEQRALGKAGFVREGVARGSQLRAGTYHDLVTYSILRSEVMRD